MRRRSAQLLRACRRISASKAEKESNIHGCNQAWDFFQWKMQKERRAGCRRCNTVQKPRSQGSTFGLTDPEAICAH